MKFIYVMIRQDDQVLSLLCFVYLSLCFTYVLVRCIHVVLVVRLRTYRPTAASHTLAGGSGATLYDALSA